MHQRLYRRHQWEQQLARARRGDHRERRAAHRRGPGCGGASGLSALAELAAEQELHRVPYAVTRSARPVSTQEILQLTASACLTDCGRDYRPRGQFTAQLCKPGAASQSWTLSPGVVPGDSKVTNVKMAVRY